MDDPNLIISGKSEVVHANGVSFRINIVRIEGNPDWSLEIVDKDNTSVVWEEPFRSDQTAKEEALRAIENEGVALFRDHSNVVPFPRGGA